MSDPAAKYWIRVRGGTPNSPCTEEELFSKYAGYLAASTPCTQVGENKWNKLVEYFPERQGEFVLESEIPPDPDAVSPEVGYRVFRRCRMLLVAFMVLMGSVSEALYKHWWTAGVFFSMSVSVLVFGIWLLRKGK